MELVEIDAGRIAWYSADVLSEVFGFGDMECLTGFMRKECEKRSLSKVGIVDRVNNLGAIA